jgi:predicted S18 family serine protease
MTNREQLIQMINNLNENGIDSLLDLFGDMDKKERYYINTSPERITELQQNDEQEKAKQEAEKAVRDFLVSSEREQLKNKYQKEFEMIGNQNAFMSQREILFAIDKVNEYESEFMKMISSYNWGYIQGVKAERSRKKVGAN